MGRCPSEGGSDMRGVWRTCKDLIFWALCTLALAAIIGPALWIIIGLLRDSAPLLSGKLLTNDTAHLGLQNAILGTLVLAVGVLVVAGPIGIGGGIYIAEFASGRIATVVRSFSEVLA